MDRALHRVLLVDAQHAVGHHNAGYALHDVVRNLTSIQLRCVVAVHPLQAAFFLDAVLVLGLLALLAQVRVQQAHAVGQHDLFFAEGHALVCELVATKQRTLDHRAAHVPEGHNRPRRSAVLVDNHLGCNTVYQQLFVGASVRNLVQLLDVVVPLKELLDVRCSDAQFFSEALIVTLRRRTEETNQKLGCKRGPSKSVTAAKQRAFRRLP